MGMNMWPRAEGLAFWLPGEAGLGAREWNYLLRTGTDLPSRSCRSDQAVMSCGRHLPHRGTS